MKLPENKNNLAGDPQTSDVLDSLLHSIPHTQSFKGKWSLIESKLSHLKTLLSDLSDFPPNPISGELIGSLIQTLSDALLLSRICHGSSLPAGKLKTQNEVDSVAGKLDNHVRDLEAVIKSGVLYDGVVSSVPGSTRESVRVEARRLVTRLQIGSVESRTLALDSLIGLIQEDDKRVLIAVAQGVVPVLVRLLDSGCSPEIRERTVTAIARVSSVDSSKHVLMAEGLLLLHSLIKVLESGNGSAKEKACVTLQSLTGSKENAKVIESRGGIASLLEICNSGTPTSQAAAAAVLRNLTAFSDLKHGFIEEHAVSTLLTLARSGTASAQEHSIACLSNLIKDDDDNININTKLLIVLKTLWDTEHVRSLNVVVECLNNLASDQRLIEPLISNGFLHRLLTALSSNVLGIRTHAAEAVYKVGYTNKTRKQLGELGFIPPLIRMLEGKSVEEVEASAKALSIILMYTENRRIYRRNLEGVISAVLLLDPSINNLDKKYVVSILISLTQSNKCRKQMVSCGALNHLQKLVSMEVEGAKSLQEAIGGGKLFGIFKR